MPSLGDCPYDGICTCRCSGLKHRTDRCKELAVNYCDGEKRKQPQSQKGKR